MKPEVTLKYLSYLRNKKENAEEGFTLIELLVVVIIIGVLAAVALPNLLNQVGKARETEIKNAVGTVNRTQQSFHFERQTFGADLTAIGLENITTTAKYLNTSSGDGVSISGVSAIFAAVNSNSDNYKVDGTRAYAAAISFDSANATYSQVLCQSNGVTNAMAALTSTATNACGTTAGLIR